MKLPKHNLLEDDIETTSGHLSYMDGFRFGLGFLVALVIGSGLVAGLAYLVVRLFKL